MNNLPTEVLWNIFQNIPERDLLIHGLTVNQLWKSSILRFRAHQGTIEFCSPNQLQKFIDTANASNTFDIRIAILHFPIDNHIKLLSIFIKLLPKLKQITTGSDTDPYPSFIIQTPTPASMDYVAYWYKHSFITKINEEKADKRELKLLNYSLGSHLPSNSSIHLQSIGSLKTKPARESIQNRNYDTIHNYYDNSNNSYNNNSYNSNNQEIIQYYSKILVLPTFNHLISLSLALKENQFYTRSDEYEMDEKMLQSIHQSCPKLENLYLFDFYMNISDNFDDLLFSYKNNPHGLKRLGIHGALFDSRCCTYFNSKYPKLESIDYTYSYKRIDDYDSRYLQYAFSIMIHRFAYLKELSLRSISYDTDYSKFWPDASMIQFLNNHSNQLVSLNYPDCLYPMAPSFNSTGENLFYKNGDDMVTLSNGLFFSHLSSLTMPSKQLIKTVTNYLIRNNKNTLTISRSIKELKIYDAKSINGNGLYLFDWLLLFPALDIFKIEHQVLVDDDSDDDDSIDGDDGFIKQYINNESSKVLHQLIDKKKEQDSIDYNKTGLYKLKTLELNNVNIKYVNGFTSLFVNFSKLNRLILSHVHYSHNGWCATNDLPRTITSICLDMPHLSLDYLSVTDVRIHSWQGNLYYLERLVKKVKLVERSTGKKSNCYYDPPSGASDSYYRALSRCHPADTFTLKLTCHGVNRFIFH
ncbi:unnamed protein product [Cunninghamella blakesleeana]